MNSNADILRRVIGIASISLSQRIKWADPVALLGALAEVESGFGENNVPRHEPIYDLGGAYFRKNQHIRDLYKKWGAWMACSYSSFQIMFPTAVELGFPGSPANLWNDDVAIHWVVEFIDRRILLEGCQTIEQFADAYNSGSFKDKLIPYDYVSRFVEAYNTVIIKRNLQPGGQDGGPSV